MSVHDHDAPFTIHRQGNLEIRMLPDVAGPLLEAGIADLPGLLARSEDRKQYRGRQDAWSFPIVAGSEPLRILWRHACRGGCARFLTKDLFHGKPRRPFQELEVSREARSRGVETPRVLAATVHDLGLGFYRGDVLLEEREAALDGLAWMKAHRGASPGRRRRVFRMAGRTLARAHDAGLRHPDLNVKNLLVLPSGRCEILDLDGARLAPLCWNDRLRCLRRLHRSLKKQEGIETRSLSSPRDLMAFLQGYASEPAPRRRILRSMPWRRLPPFFLLFWNGLLCLFAPLIAFWLSWQIFRSKRFARSWPFLLGRELPEAPTPGGEGLRVLVHGASVGEVVAALPLLERLKTRSAWLQLTTTTESGQDTARQRAPFDGLAYMPLDLPTLAGRFLDRIDPDVLVLMETELWPGLLCAAHRRGILVVVANGRLSPAMMKRYERLRSFYRRLLAIPDAFLMQSKDDAERLRRLGAAEERIRICGNLKMDQIIANRRDPRRDELATRYRLEDRPLFVAGSTHSGEDLEVIEAWAEARKTHPELRLLLAPRHLDRCEPLAARLESAGHAYLRSSRHGAIHHPEVDVILADVMGELALLYEHGTLCFVGGSLRPIGGHSPLEPAIFGRPVLWGPHMFNFDDAVSLLGRWGGGQAVENGKDLARRLVALLDDPELRKRMGEGAMEAMTEETGAADAMTEAIMTMAAGRKLP